MAMSDGMVWLPDVASYGPAASAWLAQQVRPGEDAVVVEGHPGSQACQWCQENAADLLVAAAHRGVVTRILLGSFAGFVAYHAPCSVLLVRASSP
jgi:nucleotide-binding universal stress UspA family protein